MADDDLKRVMIFEPPRHGKSEEVSRLFPAYYLQRHPERTIGLNSYAAELAFSLSRAARDNYIRDGGELRGDAFAVKHWLTHKGGGLWAAGVGGPITGKGFHLGVIDDPLKNAEQAESESLREKQKDWYRSTFYTRAEPGAAIVIVQTRWHDDDLSGWLLAQEEREEPERWHIVNLPAIKDDESPAFPITCYVEPDPREMGDALCPERYGVARLQKIQQRLGSYFWNALYQQRPHPREGGLIKRHWFDIVDGEPAAVQRLRYWDFAATEGGGAFTAGVLLAHARGIYYVCDVRRGQWSTGQREQIMRQTAELDRQAQAGDVAVWFEQEPGSSGVDAMQATIRAMAGFNVHADRATGSKDTRLMPFAAQAEAGNVKLVRGHWNEAFLDELTSVPNGKYRDQADAVAGAFNQLARQSRGYSVYNY